MSINNDLTEHTYDENGLHETSCAFCELNRQNSEAQALREARELVAKHDAEWQRKRQEEERLRCAYTKRCLHIGGSADGEWMDQDTRLQYVKVYARSETVYTQGCPDATSMSYFETYRRMEWCCSPHRQGNDFPFSHAEAHRKIVYGLAGMSDSEVIDRLLRGYYRGRQ
jgi:hypothetical protein